VVSEALQAGEQIHGQELRSSIAVGHSGDGQGHVGIYVGGSGVASANWYQGGAITVNGWGFRPSGQNDEGGGTVVVRKWLGQQ
jgi:hypothetical protein